MQVDSMEAGLIVDLFEKPDGWHTSFFLEGSTGIWRLTPFEYAPVGELPSGVEPCARQWVEQVEGLAVVSASVDPDPAFGLVLRLQDGQALMVCTELSPASGDSFPVLHHFTAEEASEELWED